MYTDTWNNTLIKLLKFSVAKLWNLVICQDLESWCLSTINSVSESAFSSALPWETKDWMAPWLLTTDWSASYSRSRSPSYYCIGHWFTVWSANSKHSSGVQFLKTARGNVEVGNAHARGRRIADTHTHTYRSTAIFLYTRLVWGSLSKGAYTCNKIVM